MTTKPWEVMQWCGLVYGNPGTKKTFFAAGLPKPMKVFAFDPAAKMLAYLLQGQASAVDWMEDGGGFQFVTDPESKKTLVELEYFLDKNPMGIGSQPYPCAYERFQTSLITHMEEGWKMPDGEPYRSVILDSYTFCELACVRLQQFKLNPAPGGVQDSKHNQMQWAGMARGVLQTDIMTVFPWVPCHALIIAHVDDKRYDEQDKQLWGVSAIGKLGINLPGAFSEVYLMYKEMNDKTGKWESFLMTESDGQYIAQTHIGAPNPCKPEWEALWTNCR